MRRLSDIVMGVSFFILWTLSFLTIAWDLITNLPDLRYLFLLIFCIVMYFILGIFYLIQLMRKIKQHGEKIE